MSAEPVTLRTFSSLVEAELVRSFLEAEGVPCHLLDDQVGAMVAMNSYVAVRLQVGAEDVARAEELLAQEPVGEAELDEAYAAADRSAGEDGFVESAGSAPRCPACGSDLVDFGRFGLAKIILSLPLLGLPLLFMDPGRQCRACGHQFSVREQGLI